MHSRNVKSEKFSGAAPRTLFPPLQLNSVNDADDAHVNFFACDVRLACCDSAVLDPPLSIQLPSEKGSIHRPLNEHEKRAQIYYPILSIFQGFQKFTCSFSK